MRGLIKDSALKDRISKLILALMLPKQTIALHKVIDVCNFPHSKPILAKPLH